MRMNRPWATAREPGLNTEAARSHGRRRGAGTSLAANAAKLASVSALLVVPALAVVSAVTPAASASVARPAAAHHSAALNARLTARVTARPNVQRAKHPSRVTASAAPGTAVAGTKVTLSASVKSSGATPTGKVSFWSGGTELCAAGLSHASTHCTAEFKVAASYTVTAKYSGDGTHASASGTTRVTATLAATSTTVSASTFSSQPGVAVTLSATVSAHSPLAATGSVKFSDASGTLCTGALSGGKTHCTYTWTAAGQYTVTARYGGDRAHAGSAATSGVITMTKLVTSTEITSIDPDSVMPGSPATVSFTVTTAPGTPAPTGTVVVAPTNVVAPVAASYTCTFKLTAASDGMGSCMVTPPNPSYGIIDYEATYEGDTAHATSFSTGTHELIVPNTTTTSVGFDPATGTVGDSDTITATVTNEAGDNISPSAGGSGTVTFSIGGTAISGCTDVPLSYTKATGNTATCDYSPSATGSVTVTATYSGDPLNLTSMGSASLSVS